MDYLTTFKSKYLRFSISTLIYCLGIGCNTQTIDTPDSLFTPYGKITDPKINESSGLVASRQFENVLWTHNDDGEPLLFAIKPSGELIRAYRIEGISNNDWEDIASDGKQLLIQDNVSGLEKSNRGLIHILQEPNPYEDDSVVVQSSIEFQFPISGEDIESLIVNDDGIYLVSKPWDDSFPRVYKLDSLTDGTYARRIMDLPALAMITGGDISDDGKRIALASYRALFIFEGEGNPDKIFEQKPLTCQLNAGQVEGITWQDEDLLISTEQGNIYLIPKRNWSKEEAPFQRCPLVDIAYLFPLPDIRTPLKTWERGTWLHSQTLSSEYPMGRLVWNESGLHLGMELDPQFNLADLEQFDTKDFDTWFDDGRIYLLLNPSGTRPMSFGPNDRCIVVGRGKNGEIDTLALTLKPATFVDQVELSPDWITVEDIDNRIRLSLTKDAPGISSLDQNREYGFNVLITNNRGQLTSWAPLTTRFPWDAPSIWGLVRLAK